MVSDFSQENSNNERNETIKLLGKFTNDLSNLANLNLMDQSTYDNNKDYLNRISIFIKKKLVEESDSPYIHYIKVNINKLNDYLDSIIKNNSLVELDPDISYQDAIKNSQREEYNHVKYFLCQLNDFSTQTYEQISIYSKTKDIYTNKIIINKNEISSLQKKLNESKIKADELLEKNNKLSIENNDMSYELSTINNRIIDSEEKAHQFEQMFGDAKLALANTNLQTNNLTKELEAQIKNYHELKKEKTYFENLYNEVSKNSKVTENKPIVKAYAQSYKTYKKSSCIYRVCFFISILTLLAISASLIYFKSDITLFLNTESINTSYIGTSYKNKGYINTTPQSSLIEFWAIKISVILVGITLISYFLKQSSHYQRLADQCHQTQTELLAYPDFMSSVSPEQSNAIKMELALKYFGRELDGSVHKDMSNLISDQMKSTTELVKASAEMVKSITQPTIQPTESSKPKDTTT